ncbi:hypothetical protein [Lacibacter sp. H407]|uniref:hypothetical protein n=1 Tax=Lacibacter sp. H407 TaxID=3133423 RepID=UPI0030C2BA63
MKKIVAVALLFLFSNVKAQESFIKHKSSVQITMEEFIQFAYNKKLPLKEEDHKNKQPFSDKNNSYDFVKKLLQDPKVPGDVRNLLDGGLGKKLDAIILYFQPLELKRLFGNETEMKKIKEDFNKVCIKNNELIAALDEIETKINEIETEIKSGKVKSGEPSTANSIKVLFAIKEKYEKQIKGKNEEMDSLTKRFDLVTNKFVFINSVSTMVLQNNEGDWDDYLLNSKNVLLVFVGNETLLAKSNVEVDLKPTSFQTELSDLYNLAKSLDIAMPNSLGYLNAVNDCKLENDYSAEKIGVSFVYLNNKKIKAPYEIKVTSTEYKDIPVQKVYEKKYLGIRIGIGAQYVDRKNFSLNSNQELTIKTDSVKANEWKSNFSLMFEFIPWGRDYNRLEPLWSKNKETNIAERIGVFGGVKLSSDPLESLFGGLSFALTKEITVGVGMAFFATPIDQKDLPVGIDASLDYLRKYSQKEYKPKFYFGIMLTPGQVVKTISGKQ